MSTVVLDAHAHTRESYVRESYVREAGVRASVYAYLAGKRLVNLNDPNVRNGEPRPLQDLRVVYICMYECVYMCVCCGYVCVHVCTMCV